MKLIQLILLMQLILYLLLNFQLYFGTINNN